MGDAAEEVATLPGAVELRGGRQHCAVAMLHRVAARVGEIVGKERVRVPFELRKLAKDGNGLPHDPLDFVGKHIDRIRTAFMMHDYPNRRLI